MPELPAIDLDDLLARAAKARESAYCPYSGYAVGAAVLSVNGNVSVGCNLENISYGLTICAERNAVAAAAVQDPAIPRVVALALVGGAREQSLVRSADVVPCGACLQVIAEFADLDCSIICATILDDRLGEPITYTLRELLPHPFGKG